MMHFQRTLTLRHWPLLLRFWTRVGSFKIVDFDLACIAHDTPVEGRIAANL
jgi:hypothetical protein